MTIQKGERTENKTLFRKRRKPSTAIRTVSGKSQRQKNERIRHVNFVEGKTLCQSWHFSEFIMC